MSRRVLVVDTSVLCCWLKVPGRETAGPAADRWDYARVDRILGAEPRTTVFVLPLATIIETGNHIAQSTKMRRETAVRLTNLMARAADASAPWAAFVDQAHLWTPEGMKTLASRWPVMATQGISIGDATISDVATYYARAGYTVEILTADKRLKAHEPTRPVPIPRRRSV